VGKITQFCESSRRYFSSWRIVHIVWGFILLIRIGVIATNSRMSDHRDILFNSYGEILTDTGPRRSSRDDGLQVDNLYKRQSVVLIPTSLTFILSSRPRVFCLILSQLFSTFFSNEKCVSNSPLPLLPSRLSLQGPVRLPLAVLASESLTFAPS
jgi:hypothetical protein